MILLNIESLIAYLKERSFDPHYFEATKQIAIILKEEGKDLPVFLTVGPTGKNLQVLMIFPCTMRPKAPSEMGRLLNLLNKEIDLPGLGMDESSGIVFYRQVLITAHGKIDKTLLNQTMDALPAIYKTFFNPIAAVAGGVYFEAIQGEVRAFLNKLLEQKA